MKPMILVLDDQSQYLRSLARALQAKYDLILTSSLDEAKAALSKHINVVLTDIRLDESNDEDRQGIDFIRFLRAGYSDMPVIAMSALDAENIEGDALAAGATRFHRKPIVVSGLCLLLDELIGGMGK